MLLPCGVKSVQSDQFNDTFKKDFLVILFSHWDEAEGKESSAYFLNFKQKQYMLPVKMYVHHKNL